MSSLEIIAALFGFACGYLTIIQNIWCWPVGIVQVVLYTFVFYRAKLYSDMILQVIFIFIQLFGWYYWVYGKKVDDRVPVIPLRRRQGIVWGGIAIGGTFALGWLMANHTKADLPYWDAATTVMSLIAQYLQGLKVLHCWLIWIAVDILAIGIYFVKVLYPTLVLYLLYLGMATVGFFTWRKKCLKDAPD